MKIKFSCHDLGRNCNFVASGTKMSEVMEKIKRHENKSHNKTYRELKSSREDMKIEAGIKENAGRH